MKIIIVPKVIKRYKNQIEFSIEENLILFLNKCFKKLSIELLIEKKIKKKPDLIILSGGNNIIKFSKKNEDKKRHLLDFFAFNYGKINKIPILGICHGAHFLLNKYKSIFTIDKKHIACRHLVKYKNEEFYVNSFHKIKVKKIKFKNKFEFLAKDSSIESFVINNHAGIVWHPEREKVQKKQIKIIKKLYEFINTCVR